MDGLNLSVFKAASIVGVLLLGLACFVAIAYGVTFITEDAVLIGAFAVLAGVVSGLCSYLVYRNYQKKITN